MNTAAKADRERELESKAGWAIHIMSGTTMRDAYYPILSGVLGNDEAGSLIYAVSRPTQRIPDFYTINELALDDLVECAALAVPIAFGAAVVRRLNV